MLFRTLVGIALVVTLVGCSSEARKQSRERSAERSKAERLAEYNALPRISVEFKGNPPLPEPVAHQEVRIGAYFDARLALIQSGRRTRLLPEPVNAECRLENKYLVANFQTEAVVVLPTFGELTQSVEVTCKHNGSELQRVFDYRSLEAEKLKWLEETIARRNLGKEPARVPKRNILFESAESYQTRIASIQKEDELFKVGQRKEREELLARDRSKDTFKYTEWPETNFTFNVDSPRSE